MPKFGDTGLVTMKGNSNPESLAGQGGSAQTVRELLVSVPILLGIWSEIVAWNHSDSGLWSEGFRFVLYVYFGIQILAIVVALS